MLASGGCEPPGTSTDRGVHTPRSPYLPVLAHATPALDNLLVFRSIHPLYGAFLLVSLATGTPIFFVLVAWGLWHARRAFSLRDLQPVSQSAG